MVDAVIVCRHYLLSLFGVGDGFEVSSTADGFAEGASERDLGIWSSFAPKGRIAGIGSHRAGGDGWRRPDHGGALLMHRARLGGLTDF
jgi:hypothetical protein